MYVSCTRMHINYTYNLSFYTSEEIVTQRQDEICLGAHRFLTPETALLSVTRVCALRCFSRV